ncbi:MAG: hypothetical protein KF773_14810 [Deltaproteobacteria bacterium]|nr:hypothetical protein [Deltaproteobacteria bacterium]
MNAVAYLVARLSGDAARRLARKLRRRDADVDEARAAVAGRWEDDLCGFLNALSREELGALAEELRVAAPGRSPELRAALWDTGAALERGGHEVPPRVQPRPVLLGGHLVVQGEPRGAYPPSPVWPREVPPAVAAEAPCEEPDSLDELLAAADRALGVRLGRRGRDKGAWGLRAEALLGIATGTETEPDWRGDVELKTLPIAREGEGGAWRVVEDPAIGMAGEPVLAKLQRTLWLARCDLPGGDATLVSWYLLDWDADVARLARKYLHDRPKGPAGTTARGLYLARKFFADAGLLATLNGPA